MSRGLRVLADALRDSRHARPPRAVFFPTGLDPPPPNAELNADENASTIDARRDITGECMG
jgi:hypothetical protein